MDKETLKDIVEHALHITRNDDKLNASALKNFSDTLFVCIKTYQDRGKEEEREREIFQQAERYTMEEFNGEDTPQHMTDFVNGAGWADRNPSSETIEKIIKLIPKSTRYNPFTETGKTARFIKTEIKKQNDGQSNF